MLNANHATVIKLNGYYCYFEWFSLSFSLSRVHMCDGIEYVLEILSVCVCANVAYSPQK